MHLFWRILGIQKLLQEDVWKEFIKRIEINKIKNKEGIIMKKRKKKLPIGLSDFKDMIEKNYYYFDKSELIENILEDGSIVKLFTRPRRFGKTLNMSMLKYFFDVENREENKKLFEGLNISKSEYFEKQGEFPVISISFKNYNKNDWESGFKSIKSTISDIYAKFED